ncbi:MAG: hypothetical protein ABI542_10110 [Gemmatimonadota bacterium]
MLNRVITLTALAALASGHLSSQIPRNAPRLGAPAANATPILVANPYTPHAADSALAVQIGTVYRGRMIDKVAGRSWNVITRSKMNEALAGYGYPADAILSAQGARDLARNVGSTRLMIFPTLSKTQDGRAELKARLTGTFNANDMAGYIVTTTQEAGQKIDDFAEKSADLMKDALRAYAENTSCVENRFTDPEKAAGAAEKAIKIIDKFAPAEYCLGHIAMLKDSTSAVAEQRFRDALTTDPQSLTSYSELGVIYQKRADSAQVISTYQQMLRIEPLNERLRETAFDLFRRYGNQDAAEQVADEGIRNDPSNTDWYDLKSNACLAQSKFACAVTELAKLYTIDSTRADTAFFQKISVSSRLAEDTAAVVKWAQVGATRYPDNLGLLDELNKAYVMVGNVDGTVSTARQLAAADPETYGDAVVRAVQALITADRLEESLTFTDWVRDHGNLETKNNFGALLVNKVQPMLGGETKNLDLAIITTESIIVAGGDNAQVNGYANYFQGLAALIRIGELDTEAAAQKSCVLIPHIEELHQKALRGLPAGLSIQPDAAPGYLKTAQEYGARIAALRTAFCK